MFINIQLLVFDPALFTCDIIICFFWAKMRFIIVALSHHKFTFFIVDFISLVWNICLIHGFIIFSSSHLIIMLFIKIHFISVEVFTLFLPDHFYLVELLLKSSFGHHCGVFSGLSRLLAHCECMVVDTEWALATKKCRIRIRMINKLSIKRLSDQNLASFMLRDLFGFFKLVWTDCVC